MDHVVTYDDLLEDHEDVVFAKLAAEQDTLDWYAEYLLVRYTTDA